MHYAVVAILRRLLNKNRIGAKHTEEKNVFRWIKNLPPHERHDAIYVWERIIKQEQLVLRCKKTGENHISLNPKKLTEIYQIIK